MDRPHRAFAATELVADEGHLGADRLPARNLTTSLQDRDDRSSRQPQQAAQGLIALRGTS